MSKNILVIVASPRPGKNTHQLADAFTEGAVSRGHNVTQFSVAGKRINGCIHCQQCYKNDPCSQKDDMLPLYPEIEKADMIVFASPIYFWQITAQMKAVIDRMYALYVAKRFQPKETAIILDAGNGSESVFDEAVSFYKNVMVSRLGWKDMGTLLVPGMTASNALDVGGLEKARAFGASL